MGEWRIVINHRNWASGLQFLCFLEYNLYVIETSEMIE